MDRWLVKHTTCSPGTLCSRRHGTAGHLLPLKGQYIPLVNHRAQCTLWKIRRSLTDKMRVGESQCRLMCTAVKVFAICDGYNEEACALQHYCYHIGWKKSKPSMCQKNWRFLLLSLSKTYKHALINTPVADLGGQTYCKSHMYSNTACVYKLDRIHPTGINIPMETKTHAPVFINFLSCILINLIYSVAYKYEYVFSCITFLVMSSFRTFLDTSSIHSCGFCTSTWKRLLVTVALFTPKTLHYMQHTHSLEVCTMLNPLPQNSNPPNRNRIYHIIFFALTALTHLKPYIL